jgi:hypothetical protein
LFGRWSGRAPVFQWTREQKTQDATLEGQKNSKHLARLWAFDEAKRLILAKQVQAAINLAGVYQLVTPVSGAVVLESKQQFEQAGLTPVDAASVPVVPEPGTIVLLVLGLGVFGFWAWRKKSLRPEP